MGIEELNTVKLAILKMLPFYIALLHGRTTKETARMMDCKELDIIQNVEAYLFSILNIAEVFRGELDIDIDDYKRRRLQFLTAAGLDEYIDETNVHVKPVRANSIDLSKFISMN